MTSRHENSVSGRLILLARSPAARALAALVLVAALGCVFNADGAFFKWGTHRDTLRQVSVIAVLACGMTLVIISGGIDLAVGSVLGLCSVLFSLVGIQLGWPPAAAVVLTLGAGTLAGLVSGGLVARFRMQPFIATLAIMVAARGLAKFVSGGQKISTAVAQADGTYRYVDVPAIFDALNSKVLGEGVAAVTVIFVLCLLLCWVVLARLRWGRYLYAIGGNEEAALMSGVPVAAVKLFAYAASGLMSAVAGMCQAAQELQGDPEAGAGYELSAIAMVVIGGTSLSGGRGSMGLTLIGVVTIGYLEKILSINAIGEASRLILTGAIIVAAVLFQKGRK
jgi:ribose transport system permease protein